MAGCGTIEGGLWGCIVMVAAFFIQVITFGTGQSIGIYNVELLQYFDAGAAAVSLCGSINLGLLLGAGPLASILMTRWSCRQIALVGAVLANIGMITMPFSPNLPFMYVFYGVITGLGYCLLYVPSHVLCGLYFYRQRSFATGIAKSGSGMGASVFPIIFYHLIENLGWRGSFFIVAGINLHLFVFAALLRPVPESFLVAFKIQEKADQQQKANDARIKTDTVSNNDGEIENTEILPTVVMETESSPEAHCGSPMLTDSDEKLGSRSSKNQLKKHFLSIMRFDFIFFCLSNIFWNAGVGVLLIFLPEYMATVGISKESSSMAFTALGVGACVGSLVGGLLGNVKCFNRILLYIVGNLVAGLVTLLMVWPYFHSFICMFVLVLLFGLMLGIVLGLLVVVTSDLLGTEALSDGFGYLAFSDGVGTFVGPPLAGIVIDASRRFGPGIIFSAILTMMAGIVMGVVPIKRRLLRRIKTTA